MKKKNPGLDKIPSKLLKTAAGIITPLLTNIQRWVYCDTVYRFSAHERVLFGKKKHRMRASLNRTLTNSISLEIVFSRAAPAFHNLFMGCVYNLNTVQKTVVEKLTFQTFYISSHSCK